MTLGEKIKKVRAELRYSQSAFSNIISISQTALSSYELDQKQPTFETMKKIMRFAKQNKIKVDFLED